MRNDTPSPGQINYTAYHATWLRLAPRLVRPTWSQLTPEDQHAWEAAAQAVLTQAKQPHPCTWCDAPIAGEPFDDPFLTMVFGYLYCSKECRDAHVFSK